MRLTYHRGYHPLGERPSDVTPEERAAKKAAWNATYATHPKRHPKWKYPDGKPPRDQRPRVKTLQAYVEILEAALRRAKGEGP